MTSTAGLRPVDAAPSRHERRPLAIFASAGDEERRRRPSDVATLVLAVVVVLAGVRQSQHPIQVGVTLARLLTDLPDWLKTILGGAFAVATLYAAFLIVVAVAARDRRGLVRDLAVAVAGSIAVGALLSQAVSGDWPSLDTVFDRAGPHFPELRLAIVVSIVSTASPHVIRPARRLGAIAILLTALGALALDLASTADALGALGVGIGMAALVHLAWGSPGGAPSLFRVRRELTRLGIEVGEFTILPAERGALELGCTDQDGRALRIKVYGRDAVDTQLLSRFWRFLCYRHGVESPTLTRAQQVEHEALAILLARRGGVTTSDLVATASTASGDKLLVTVPVPQQGSGPLSSAHLDGLWSQLTALHAARMVHGRINGDHVVASGATAVGVEDWATAAFEPPAAGTDAEVAAALVLAAQLAGTDAAVQAARRSVGDAGLTSAIPYLQSAALTPSLRRSAKAAKVDLDELRHKAAEATGGSVPDLVKLHRVKWSSLLMTAVTVFAVWYVIGQIADIGWDTIQSSFQSATWGWIVAAIIVGQLPRFSDAVTVLGACDQPLPYGPTVGLEMSISFINLAVPSTAARVALEVRFFQRQGVPTAKALTFGALASVSQFITQLAILAITVGFGLTSLDFSTDASSISASTIEKLVLLIAIAVAVGLLVVVLVKRIRTWVAHFLEQAVSALRGIGAIRRWGPLFGGNLMSQTLFSITLGLCAEAFGHHVSFVNLMAINVMVAFFAGIMPVPGGIGVTEAGLTTCLVAAGIPEGAAVSTVLVYRAITYYLPPVWGFFTTRWLRQHEYL